MPEPRHIVAVGRDHSALDEASGSDSRIRHIHYGTVLGDLRPGSSLSLIVVGAPADLSSSDVSANTTFVPVPRSWLTDTFRPRNDIIGAALDVFDGERRLPRVLDLLHTQKPIDIVTTQTIFEDAWAAHGFCRRRGIPLVGQIHSDIFADEALPGHPVARILGRLRRHLGRRCLDSFSALRVVGQSVARDIRATGWTGEVRVVPVPTSLPDLPCVTRLAASPLVLFVGRLHRQKNVHSWLRVADKVKARLPGTRFEIVGHGPLRSELENYARALGLTESVSFRGHVPHDRLADVYARAALLLLTSAYEGFGRVAVEAMEVGIPVVAPRICGLEDIVVDGETGFLTTPNDEGEMARAVCALLEDVQLRHSFGQAGRHRVGERFDFESMAADWMRMLLEVADAGARGLR